MRALEMAKNIFVKGKLKNLRAALRQYKKDIARFDKNFEEYDQREEKFKGTNWTTDNQANFLQEKYSLTKEKVKLDAEKKHPADFNLSLDKQKSDLEEFCKLPESVKQIQFIATAILRKNHKFVDKVKQVDKKLKELSKQLQHTKSQMKVVELQLKMERHTTCYKIFTPKYNDKTDAALSADVILGEPQVVQLVARSSDNNFEISNDFYCNIRRVFQ